MSKEKITIISGEKGQYIYVPDDKLTPSGWFSKHLLQTYENIFDIEWKIEKPKQR